jgi:hypothetical protein
MAVVVSTVVKSMLVAHLTGCIQGAVKVAADNSLRIIPLNTKNHFDTVMRKDIHGARPHASRQDDGRALLAQPHREYSATVLRRSTEMGVTD